ncbi:ejaculatory bulb-specific protein 3-like [Macrosteles quadrilineatus]|uniref:ejaculatory bulb-specific protein 3-like n=1 Tax=Macrosteles quadrilineatus TaxID=74068 RepID=UPI0023E1140B|nr:ejaculatory bulb-specific protein 3-like [Macrosteles quadrilineatus]XP_054278092.1 ejaculatory bulb-specific protein 3-like [Macrosteles quadrilineatus]
MASTSVLCLLAVLVTVATAAEKYTTKYDSVNVDQIIGNNRLFSNYIKCLLDQGGCTPEAEELKSHIRDALETGCKKCSQKQREGADKVFRHLIKNKPKEFDALEKKYDPKGSFRARYQAEANKRGLKI